MTIESAFSSLFQFINGVLSLDLPVGQYKVTYWQVLIYGFIVFKLLQIFFSVLRKE